MLTLFITGCSSHIGSFNVLGGNISGHHLKKGKTVKGERCRHHFLWFFTAGEQTSGGLAGAAANDALLRANELGGPSDFLSNATIDYNQWSLLGLYGQECYSVKGIATEIDRAERK